MPQFNTPSVVSQHEVASGIANGSALMNHHRKLERERIMVPELPDAIIEASVERQVFIYNVGTMAYQQSCGSAGTFFIPALTNESDVFGDDLKVAGPVIVPGVPYEPYPSEGEAKIIFHKPRSGRANAKKAGMDFALGIIGAGAANSKAADLRHWGVFVSEQIEQKQPAKGAAGDAWEKYRHWQSDVKTAREQLRKTCEEYCAVANAEHSRGKFALLRDDMRYDLSARLLKKTNAECPWRVAGDGNSSPRQCISCFATLNGGALKCGACGEKQLPEEEYQKEIARRRESAAGVLVPVANA